MVGQRPRVDFTDPRRFEQMRERCAVHPDAVEPLSRWERAKSVGAFVLMVAGGVVVVLGLLGW